MPRKMEFTRSDVHLIEVLFDQLRAKPGACYACVMNCG
jgi:hypothetical protein